MKNGFLLYFLVDIEKLVVSRAMSRLIPTPWNYRELATCLILSKNLAKGEFEQLGVGSMRKNVINELSWHLIDSDISRLLVFENL